LQHDAIAVNPWWTNLLACQRKAFELIRDSAARERARARDNIRSILARAGLSDSLYEAALRGAHAHARVGLHFHPERLSRAERIVAESLLQSGIYKNQFETGLSGGSPTAFPGGERDLWEIRLFGDAVQRAHAPSSADIFLCGFIYLSTSQQRAALQNASRMFAAEEPEHRARDLRALQRLVK
jgi:hypothetical protein